MIVRLKKEKNTISQKPESYLELIAETIKEEVILENIHFDFNLRTNLFSESDPRPRKRKSKKCSLKIRESRWPA